MRKLLIFGAAAFAELAHYYFTHDSEYSVAAFTVDAPFVREPVFLGLPVIPFEQVVERFPPDQHDLFVAVGYQDLNRQRASKMADAAAKGYRLASFISTKAAVPDGFSVGPNSMVQERAVIQPFVTLGRGSIVWSTTRIGFHTTIGDCCWIVCALFGESVKVGDNTFIGLNATIGPSISIGRSNVIGAGALVLKDTEDGQIYRSRATRPSAASSDQLKF